MSILTDAKLQVQIDRLHSLSRSQEPETYAYFERRARAGDLDWDALDADAHAFFADRLVALDPDKAEFCHLLCRAMRAQRVVEVGTSYGVSTLYLADAVRANGGGVVIGTEHEAGKAAAARANFAEAGLDELIELREGDLAQTLQDLTGPVDFVLMDIWTEMVCPAMRLITPHLRTGAAVVCDNTVQFREAYSAYFKLIERAGFVTRTLPFAGGLELSIKI
ncbi:MAG: class I SAM-dependent methyltransferase [Pseudomonadales bacterium]|jgi:predicted O-methyltransferase YrrM